MSTPLASPLSGPSKPLQPKALPWLWSTVDSWAEQIVDRHQSATLGLKQLKWDPGFQSQALASQALGANSLSLAPNQLWAAANDRQAAALTRLFQSGLALGLAIERRAEEISYSLPFSGITWSLLLQGPLWMIAASSAQSLADWLDANEKHARHKIENEVLGLRGNLWSQWMLNQIGQEELARFLWTSRSPSAEEAHNGGPTAKGPFTNVLEQAHATYKASRFALSRSHKTDQGMREPRVALLEAQVTTHLKTLVIAPPIEPRLVHRTLHLVQQSLVAESAKSEANNARNIIQTIQNEMRQLLVSSAPGQASINSPAKAITESPDEVGSILRDWNALQHQWKSSLERFDDWSDEMGQRHHHSETQAQADRFESLAEFAAGAGHELNNPLAVIQGRAQLLLAKAGDDATKLSLKAIIDQTLRAHRMLRDLIFIARPGHPRPRYFRPADQIRSVAAELKDEAARHDVQLDVSFCPAAARLETDHLDPDHFRHMTLSLLRNALEASRQSGRVHVALRLDGPSLKLTVDDNGRGFDSRESVHLFDPFYCGRKAGRGLGLGLPRLARIVEQFNGRVRYRSQPNGGSVFEVILPLPETGRAAISTSA